MAAVTADASLFSPRPSHDPSAPQPAAAGAAQQPATDALDDLFNYDADIDAVFGDVNNPTAQRTNAQGQPAANRNGDAAGNDGAGLGIDEEIKIRKPRKRAAKLDEERLLSEKGIAKLRKISKDRLKFRGKGHEFSDVSRLLNTYQLWLDDMFPKAKFGDGLALIEKLGHKKRLQVMRKTWIDEEKHKDDNYDVADVDGDFVLEDDNVDLGNGAENNMVGGDEKGRPEDSDHDDLYTRPTPAPTVNRNAEEPAEDELDALLAESGFEGPPQGQTARDSRTADIDDFADDEEAMAGMW